MGDQQASVILNCTCPMDTVTRQSRRQWTALACRHAFTAFGMRDNPFIIHYHRNRQLMEDTRFHTPVHG